VGKRWKGREGKGREGKEGRDGGRNVLRIVSKYDTFGKSSLLCLFLVGGREGWSWRPEGPFEHFFFFFFFFFFLFFS